MKSCKQEEKDKREDVHPGLGGSQVFFLPVAAKCAYHNTMPHPQNENFRKAIVFVDLKSNSALFHKQGHTFWKSVLT